MGWIKCIKTSWRFGEQVKFPFLKKLKGFRLKWTRTLAYAASYLCLWHWRGSERHKSRCSWQKLAEQYLRTWHAGNMKCFQHKTAGVWKLYSLSPSGWGPHTGDIWGKRQVGRSSIIGNDLYRQVYQINTQAERKNVRHHSPQANILVVPHTMSVAKKETSNICKFIKQTPAILVMRASGKPKILQMPTKYFWNNCVRQKS